MLVIKNKANNNIYIPWKNYTIFCKHSMELHLMKLYPKLHFHKYFYYILQLIDQLSSFLHLQFL